MSDKGMKLMEAAAKTAESQERKRLQAPKAEDSDDGDSCPHCGTVVERMAKNADPDKRDAFVKSFRKATHSE